MSFQRWQAQYEALRARLDEAVRAMETAIREKWQVLQAGHVRLYEQARQQAFQAATEIRDRVQKLWGLY